MQPRPATRTAQQLATHQHLTTMTATFVPPVPPRRTRRAPPTCSLSPPPDESLRAALPLSRTETSTLLSRMLAVAVADEDYRQAAQLRDAAEQLDAAHPTFALRRRLEAALSRQDFARAAALRDEIDRVNMHAVADRCKPRYPLGLVVVHRRLSYRMVLFGADYRCRAPRATAGQAWGSRRGELQPWYHAAVDERDKSTGDNIVYVAEDDCVPAPPGVQVQHPITRIMFRGLHSQRACPGYSWYVPVGNEEAENMRCVDG